LAFARDFSLLLHDEFRFLTLSCFPYLANSNAEDLKTVSKVLVTVSP
jgi:hypothetical protein